ncbi:MAG: hypothetical protein EZS28_039562 [Streblomastix strix]|uniref:Nucleoporin NSP1-like C-terminal domain-containing protein n=1 Tax=Streblomastix strix TaxID=222440 RepID=A0A5J4U4P9_9EUKA|nr:MAG: hypothetical protein EZS28_039562 [Streblomastix strix]
MAKNNKQQQQIGNNTTKPASSQNPFNIPSTGTNWNFNSGGLTQAPPNSTQPQTTQIPADIQDRTLKDLADIWQDELDILKKKYDRQAEAVYRMDALIRKNQDKVKNLMRNYISQKNSQDYVKTKSSEILEGQKELFKQLEDLETKVDKEIEDNKGDQVQSRLEMFFSKL